MFKINKCCFVIDHVLGVQIIAYLFLLKDVSIGATACASLAVNEPDQHGTALSLTILAFSVIYVFSSFMLLLGTLERSAPHFVPFVICQGVHIILILVVMLESLFSGHIIGIGFLVYVSICLYLWVVVVELYYRLDDYQKLDDMNLHI